MITIRAERPSDRDAIYRVQREAFGKEPEAQVVDEMRATDRFDAELSLVAEADGEIAGHVLLSYADLVQDGAARRVLMLGPIGVAPEQQGRGIGSELMRAALAAAGERGEPLVVLEGNPAYYRRFGFVLAAKLGIAPPPGVPERYFQAVKLGAYDPALRGTIRYARPFEELP